MSTLVNWNGQQYLVPAYNDTGYAQGNGNLSQYLVALSTGSLQQIGGLFQLTADADFGPNFGLVSSYYKSRTANIASAGVLRLANTDAIKWRNSNNSADVTLAMNATGTAARTYTIPDVATASFVMTEGAQTINGAKTFGSAIVGSLTGAASLNLLLTGGTLSGTLKIANGTEALPSLTFAGDTGSDTGLFWNSENNFSLVTAGANKFQIGTGGVYPFVPVRGADGTVSAPTYSFANYDSTGIYAAATPDIRFTVGGSLRMYCDSTVLTVVNQIQGNSGTVSAPQYSFYSDTTTGLFYRAANIFCVAAGGSKPIEFNKINGTAGTNENPAVFYYGVGGTTYVSAGTNTSITTAKTICFTNNAAGLVLVYGTDGGGNTFVDLILSTDASVTPTTISSKTIAGSPAARTYSVSGGATKVAFASGTYSAKAFCIGIG